MGRQVLGTGNPEGLPISEAVRAGDFVFLSGLVGFDPDGKIISGGIAAETHAILAEAKRLLALAGGGLDDLVKVNVYLADPAEFDEFNAAYRVHFPNSAPARISVSTRLTIDARVEIDFIAYVGAA
jgi:2-iminobutanoate/2-iminopropanoate deaminase